MQAGREFLDNLEQMVVRGQHTECRDELKKNRPAVLSREVAMSLAQISFRIHFPQMTLKLLHPYIYPKNSFAKPATDQEKMIYASALYSFGADGEARRLLTEISDESDPEVWFHRAAVEFCIWDYQKGLEFFKKYIACPALPPYKILVGQVNQAAALIALSQWSEAEALLQSIQNKCAAGQFRLLRGNSHELLAQVHLFQKRYAEADAELAKAEILLQGQGGFYELYVQKWQTISRCLQSSTEENLQSLEALKLKAFSLGHWNTVRECDLFRALALGDEALMKKVVLGTPYRSYRQKARELFDRKTVWKGAILLKLGTEDAGPATLPTRFDPYQKGLGQECLYEKPMLLSLFQALTEDFYQPSNIGSLFQKIYPTEVFNPFTSPARVLQLLRRLGKWFTVQNAGLRVHFKKSEFRIVASRPVLIQLERGPKLNPASGKLSQLHIHHGSRPFSSRDVAMLLGLSKTSANRLIAEAIKAGQISKVAGRVGKPYRITHHLRLKRSA